MPDTIVLPFLIIGFIVGIAAGGLVWVRARGGPDNQAPPGREFRTLFASGAALFSAGIVLSVVFAALGWVWYVPALLLAVGLLNMSIGFSKHREWQDQ
jgi:hypothetical protein